MALSKKEKNLLIICGVVAAGAGIYQFVIYPAQQKDAQPSAPAAKPAVAAAAVQTAQTQPAAKALPAEAKLYESWGRDPFMPGSSRGRSASGSGSSGQAVQSRPKLVLKGIFWKRGVPHALINDHVLAVGEAEDGIRVTRISGSEVVCTHGNRTLTLYWSDMP